MPSFATITSDKLARLIGLADTPVIIDVRTPEDFAAEPRHIPTALRRSHKDVAEWAPDFAGMNVVTVCQRGQKLSEGSAAWLRHAGARAENLEGGFEAWRAAGLPLVPDAAIAARDVRGRTVWVTRQRPKIDRIACPWLIRRFVDRDALFLFVAPADVNDVADRFKATPFDVEGVVLSHRGERCSFDTMLDTFGLDTPALRKLAAMVRAADTGRLGEVPEAAGLLAASLGLSRIHRDDLAQLAAGMGLYDAFYRWCRDAMDETHDWPAGGAGKAEARVSL